MGTESLIPMPPPELRLMVTTLDADYFDNPNGVPIIAGVPLDAFGTVFDFGCGCGRLARQLLQQNPKPRRYVGIDIHKGMIDWCSKNLTPVDCNFQFFHHDVYSPGHGLDNSLKLAEPFPVKDEEFSLVIAISVFTHLYKEQATYYLSEIARILAPQGVALASWFFFDNESFPFLRDGPFCLFTDELDPTQAVIYDREWFLDTIRSCGLSVQQTVFPPMPGHQWNVFLRKRTPNAVDQFPLGEEGAAWLCGATRKPIAKVAVSDADKFKVEDFSKKEKMRLYSNGPPVLTGPVVELAAAKAKLKEMETTLAATKWVVETLQRSWSWKIGRVLTSPVRFVRSISPRLG